jgi:hypothetical protein
MAMSSAIELGDAFAEACHDAGFAPHDPVRTGVEMTLRDPHFGYVMEDNLRAATKVVQGRRADEAMPIAMGTLAHLLGLAGENYRRHDQLPSYEMWEEHVENVRDGQVEISLLPRFWSTPEDGQAQVGAADHFLSLYPQPRVQQQLAEINYQLYFNRQTMAGADKTLDITPDAAAAVASVEGMPHLTVANWALGQLAQRVYERMSRNGRGNLHIVDMGSGTGATMAAIMNRLHVAQERGSELAPERLSVTGIETAPAFFRELLTKFPLGTLALRSELGLDSVRGTVGTSDLLAQPETGLVRLVKGDIGETIEAMDFAGLPPHDVVLAIGNYALHCIPASTKDRMIGKLAQAPNLILGIGDLTSNSSVINRGYFNLSNNGPLNAGNIGLQYRLAHAGFLTSTVGYMGYRPDYIDESLTERLAKELTNDGFVTVATHGRRAEELLAEA